MNFTHGMIVVYDDGRPGHRGVKAEVLEVREHGMTVQFEDRADVTHIDFADQAWMRHLVVWGEADGS